MFVETYSEYRADCCKCGKEILEVIEYMDIEYWDDEVGVCPVCKAVFCGKCLVYSMKAGYRCPYCLGEVMQFDFVYDLIGIIEHNYQPFEGKTHQLKTIKQIIVDLESLLEEEECTQDIAEKIKRQIRELKVRDMFEHGQKQIFQFIKVEKETE